MRITILDRLLLLVTGLLAAWQVAVGVDGDAPLPMVAYTIGFGVLMVASLLIIILGFEALDSPVVVILSTVIPLSISLGLIWEHWPSVGAGYLVFVILGFLAVLSTRLSPPRNRLPILVLAVVHGVSGLTIFLLPFIWALTGRAMASFALVGVGGALMGIGGLLLSFLRAGRPLLSKATILRVFPGLLLIMTVAFVVGFNLS